MGHTISIIVIIPIIIIIIIVIIIISYCAYMVFLNSPVCNYLSQVSQDNKQRLPTSFSNRLRQPNKIRKPLSLAIQS